MSSSIVGVLADAQEHGLVGPSPLDPHIAHALGFAEAVRRARGEALSSDDRMVDLGAGGGLPGLVLAAAYPAVRMRLVEGSSRRATFLERAVLRCQLEGRVEVVGRRAELAGRDPVFRGGATVVVSRSFGSPGETAECASPFLVVGGVLVVSEPPQERAGGWPRDGLALLGLEQVFSGPAGGGYAVFRQLEGCPDRYPRRVGVPRKRPLF